MYVQLLMNVELKAGLLEDLQVPRGARLLGLQAAGRAGLLGDYYANLSLLFVVVALLVVVAAAAVVAVVVIVVVVVVVVVVLLLSELGVGCTAYASGLWTRAGMFERMI